MGLKRALWRAGLAGAAALLAAQSPSAAATADPSLRKAANVLTIALPVAAVGVSLLHHEDWKGVAEFAVSAGLTVGSAYLIRKIVRERRPDHFDFNSMTPPDVAISDASADYLWSRYGWRYGVPAFIARSIVSYADTDGKKNHWYDTLASGALAFGFNYAIVTRYRDSQRYHVGLEAEPGGASLHFTMNF
ncbi:MAG TPA: hypothetical protein VNU97_09655 [Rhizomicrobium sp.]|jgi:hypothetical protein|nr:hypothetical protein [Rhizomicrobium sp.]